MLESFTSDNFTYKKLTEAEQKQRGILGRLKGIIADCVNPTRNGRKYSRQLWENVFNNDIIKEKIANRCLFGELGHPADREEVDPEKIAICLAEVPKINKDGKIYGVFDILDTPCGRILKSLCDYGCKIGVSSRGTGDLIPGDDGGDEVDPDTYNCECWDAVLVPAIESARESLVMESLNKRKKPLKTVLLEQLNKATPNGKKAIKEALEEIGYADDIEIEEDAMTNPNQQEDEPEEENIEVNIENESGEGPSDIDSDEVDVDKSEESKENPELVAEFQEALKKAKKLEKDNQSLKEQLSVCNAKGDGFKEELARYKKATIVLSESAKKVKTLKEDLKKKDQLLEARKQIISRVKTESKSSVRNKLLAEAKTNKRIEELEKQVEKLTEELNKTSKQLGESKDLLGKYRNSYRSLKEHYLEMRAESCGLEKEEILSKLNESYKVKDIDSVCEEMREVKRNLDKLPFTINESTSFKVKPSKEYINGGNVGNQDDIVSDTLLMIANLK